MFRQAANFREDSRRSQARQAGELCGEQDCSVSFSYAGRERNNIGRGTKKGGPLRKA